MGALTRSMFSCSLPIYALTNETMRTHNFHFWGDSFWLKPMNFGSRKLHPPPALVAMNVEEIGRPEIIGEEKSRFKWVEVGPDITEAQKQAISQLPPKMTKRCKSLMKQIICYSPQKTSLSDLLAAWVKIMKPRRADWLSVLKELWKLDHPMLFEVAELACLEQSFEANIRDYTKLIDSFGKENRLQDAENTLLAMKRRGFTCDQVILTAMIHMYSKAGNLKLAEETFEEIKLLGQPLDKRSYGSMITAYIRAGMPDQGEILLKEMESLEIYAGREVYKALLRAYSMTGDTEGAQRVFDAIQFAGIVPDVKLCGLLINAYGVAGQSEKARIAFENLRRAGLEPSDKCVALMLAAYEKENKLNKALDFLIDLERDGIMVEKEGSEILARWFLRLGVVEEVELVLRDYAAKEANCKLSAS
ncbi:hypothetical protein L1049_018005 [Liquidambar formosana]|uniref:Pentatricopeptide repeat-containing protein n=1 Tax=Liquidambar formosana TaxID=63359 RepID=A0AAP0NHS6_LIQFO